MKAECWGSRDRRHRPQLREGSVLKLMSSGDWKISLCGKRWAKKKRHRGGRPAGAWTGIMLPVLIRSPRCRLNMAGMLKMRCPGSRKTDA